MNTTTPLAEARRAGDRSATERILLASDGGHASAAALRWVIERVAHRSADVEIVNVSDPTATDAAERRVRVGGMARVLTTISPSVRVTITDSVADPLELLARAREDIVVVGAHRGDRKRTPFAEFAASRAEGPVVVVPSEWICREGPVMVGVGAEDDVTAALAFAEREAAARGEDIRLIHAWQTTGLGEVPPAWDFGTESIPERQRRALERLAQLERESHPDVPLTSEAVQGRVVARLTEAARTASLLVVGRSHRNTVVRAMFGSTANGLLGTLPCPVAVIP